MARKLHTTARKSASQERSRLTVQAILEATARVLMKEGYDRASTNKIAAKAGVSIGSLYQYFPSKEALKPVRRGGTRFRADRNRGSPPRSQASSRPCRRSPTAWTTRKCRDDQPGRSCLIRGYLDAHRDEIDIADLDLAAFICVTVVEALTHAAVLHRPDILTDGKAKKFVDSSETFCAFPRR